MSRLYASIDADASKTQATRRGHKRITAHVRGWEKGVEVVARIDKDGIDIFEIYETGGSNYNDTPRLIATVKDSNAL